MSKPARKKKQTMKRTRGYVLGFRVDAELKAAIEAAAAADQRSVSQWIAIAVAAALKRS